jgi:hypothetical protein
MAITKIAQVDVGAGGASYISLSSIPATFTDLMVVASLRSNGTNGNIYIQPNFASSYDGAKWLRGNGSAVSSDSVSTTLLAGVANESTQTTSTFSNVQLYIPNYASPTNKSYFADTVQENNGSAAIQQLSAGSWSVSGVMNRLDIFVGIFGSTTILQYSSISLYGISKSGATGATVA